MARAAATIAERPSSGNIPAWAARPRKWTSSLRWYGAPRITSPIGPAWSYTYPTLASSRDSSKAAAPRRPTSSFGVKRSSTPACARPSSTNRAIASSIDATAALLSAPRIVPAVLRTIPSSPTTGSIGPFGGTVSRCAQKNRGIAAPSPLGSSEQRMFPIDEPIRGPAVVFQRDTTTVLPPGWSARADSAGNLLLSR